MQIAMRNFISTKVLLLLILVPLSCVTAHSPHTFNDAFSIANELEVQFGCKFGSVAAEEHNLLNGNIHSIRDFCPGYGYMVFEIPLEVYGLDPTDEPPLYLGVDEIVQATNEGLTHFRNKCHPTDVEGIKHSAATHINEDLNLVGCPFTSYTCASLPDAEDFIEYDEACLRGVFEKVSEFRTKMNPPIGASCRDTTADLEHELHLTYEQIKFDEDEKHSNVYGVDRLFEIEYTTNSPEVRAYKNLCVELKGHIRQIDFLATCVVWAQEGWENTEYEKWALRVSGRPRCYSVECSPEDDEGLLRKHTLLETEKLFEDENPGIFMSCAESTMPSAWPSVALPPAPTHNIADLVFPGGEGIFAAHHGN